jgi:serpin B
MTTAPTVRTDFATGLYAHLAKTQPAKDFFLSPFSIQVALAMCAAGAKGETRRVLAELIGAPLGVAEQNRQYAAWLKSVNTHERGGRHVQLTTANALWVQQGERLQPDYQKAVADFYDSALSELDFRALPDQAVKSINAWVKGKTLGKIKELIGRQVITADTRLVLTNAIYFKGKWASAFDKTYTRDEDWHGAGGVRKVALMQQKRGYLYHECDDFQALDLPYQGEQLSMLVVLPRKMDGLAALESTWAAAPTYQQVTDSLVHEKAVFVSLPRFKMETEFQLKPALCDMGAALAFSASADFSGIGAGPLMISEVIHKAFIEVNEEGTEAAAATGVVMAKSAAIMSEPKYFQADHPFLFVIRDRKTNVALFCGRVLEPTIT